MKPTLLILAAGMGSRYGGLKQLDEVGPNGEAIIDYSLYDAIRAGFGKVVFVIRNDFEEAFKNRFDKKLAGHIEVEYAYQELTDLPKGFNVPGGRVKPWGTGHAIRSARNCINEPFVAINADDFYGWEAFKTMSDFLQNDCCPEVWSMVGYRCDKTLSENGSVSRGVCVTDEDNFLIDITERTNIQIENDGIFYYENDKRFSLKGDEPVSMNFWGFSPDLFTHLEKGFVDFLREKGGEMKSEFYIPSQVSELKNKGLVKVKVLSSDARWFGVTYKEDKEHVVANIQKMIDENKYPVKLF